MLRRKYLRRPTMQTIISIVASAYTYNPPVDRFFVIHYHELGLKKGNRDYFENRLCANMNAVLEDCGTERARRISGRVLLPLKPDADIAEIKNRLGRVFGIAYFAEAWASPQAVENL